MTRIIHNARAAVDGQFHVRHLPRRVCHLLRELRHQPQTAVVQEENLVSPFLIFPHSILFCLQRSMQYCAICNLKVQRLRWSAFMQDIQGLKRRRNPISTHHVASAYRMKSRQIAVHKTLLYNSLSILVSTPNE
jgi:hypothetical protein